MVASVIMYQCEHCEFKYDTLEEANSCEESHRDPSDYNVCKIYQQRSECGFPSRIYVKVVSSTHTAKYNLNQVVDENGHYLYEDHDGY